MEDIPMRNLRNDFFIRKRSTRSCPVLVDRFIVRDRFDLVFDTSSFSSLFSFSGD